MDIEAILHELRPFLDTEGRLTALPAKHRKKLAALYYLATKIEGGRQYTEYEINVVLDDLTLFHDPATVRRELFNKHLLNRADDGSLYWKEELPAPADFMAKYL